MRVFVALELPENIKNEIIKLQREIEKLNLMKGKLIEKENLHLTLKFLGEIGNDKVREIENKLKKIRFNKFEVELDKIGVFSENFIRIVWVSLSGEKLFELQKAIDDILESIFDREERFMAHITVARPKSVNNKSKFIEEIKKVKFDNKKFLVDRVYLKSSELKPQGPVYANLFKLDLV